jgi:hypothetical protein
VAALIGVVQRHLSPLKAAILAIDADLDEG